MLTNDVKPDHSLSVCLTVSFYLSIYEYLYLCVCFSSLSFLIYFGVLMYLYTTPRLFHLKSCYQECMRLNHTMPTFKKKILHAVINVNMK